MAGSPTFRVKRTARFDRSLKDLIRLRYRNNPRGEKELGAFLIDTLTSLGTDGKVSGAKLEPWPHATHQDDWHLWKLYFTMPRLHGAAAEGRLIYLVNNQEREVVLAWVYSHADFAGRPPDAQLRAVFAEAIASKD